MKNIVRRLEQAIKIAEDQGDAETLRTLILIRDGSLLGRTNRGSNVARLHDRERKMKGW